MTVSSFFDREDEYTKAYQDMGVPVFDSPEKAAIAMTRMVEYKKIRERKPHSTMKIPMPSEKANQILKNAQKKEQKSLDEFAAKNLLSCYGIPTTAEQVVNSAEMVADAAKNIGFPVAVKVCDPDILHKSERGLVHLNIDSERDAVKSFQEIQKICKKPVPVLVSKMEAGKREFLAGTVFDEQFGHCVAFGTGGIFAEKVNDITYRKAPLCPRDAKEMLNDINASILLGSLRGLSAADMDALADILIRLSLIPLIHPEIREIDINPLIISSIKPIAVDSIITIG